MPPVIPQHFLDAKRRMKMGLHPAVLAAVQRIASQPHDGAPRDLGRHGTLAQQTLGAFNRGEIPLSLGSGVNRMSSGLANASLYGGEGGATARLGRTYQRELRRGLGGRIQEVHDYGGRLGSVVFDRKPTPELQAMAAQRSATLAQHLSNTATAEDKLIALAHRQAAAQGLGSGVGQKRRFSRKPGPMQRY
jgi:hypothetical protein